MSHHFQTQKPGKQASFIIDTLSKAGSRDLWQIKFFVNFCLSVQPTYRFKIIGPYKEKGLISKM